MPTPRSNKHKQERRRKEISRIENVKANQQAAVKHFYVAYRAYIKAKFSSVEGLFNFLDMACERVEQGKNFLPLSMAKEIESAATIALQASIQDADMLSELAAYINTLGQQCPPFFEKFVMCRQSYLSNTSSFPQKTFKEFCSATLSQLQQTYALDQHSKPLKYGFDIAIKYLQRKLDENIVPYKKIAAFSFMMFPMFIALGILLATPWPFIIALAFPLIVLPLGIKVAKIIIRRFNENARENNIEHRSIHTRSPMLNISVRHEFNSVLKLVANKFCLNFFKPYSYYTLHKNLFQFKDGVESFYNGLAHFTAAILLGFNRKVGLKISLEEIGLGILSFLRGAIYIVHLPLLLIQAPIQLLFITPFISFYNYKVTKKIASAENKLAEVQKSVSTEEAALTKSESKIEDEAAAPINNIQTKREKKLADAYTQLKKAYKNYLLHSSAFFTGPSNKLKNHFAALDEAFNTQQFIHHPQEFIEIASACGNELNEQKRWRPL